MIKIDRKTETEKRNYAILNTCFGNLEGKMPQHFHSQKRFSLTWFSRNTFLNGKISSEKLLPQVIISGNSSPTLTCHRSRNYI